MKVRWSILIVLFMCSSCNTIQGMVPQTKEPNTVTATADKPSATSSPIPTSLATFPPALTVTPKLNPTSTSSKIASLELTQTASSTSQQCRPISTVSLDAAAELKGVLVLFANTHKIQDSYLMDLETKHRSVLPEHDKVYLSDGSVSSGGKWLSYMVWNKELSDSELLIVSSDGKAVKALDFSEYVRLSGSQITNEGWVDNERLAIGYEDRSRDIRDGRVTSTLILNPFLEEKQILNTDFPGLYGMPQPNFWANYALTRVVYDPRLRLAIFPTFDRVILWDIRENKEIASDPQKPVGFGGPPVWSPDGKNFIIELDLSTNLVKQLYRIDTTGRTEQLTQNESAGDWSFAGYSWSPDGKYISFWGRQGSEFYLTVLEVATRQAAVFCVQSYDDPYPHRSPIWSPDSKHILIVSEGRPPENDTQVFILDPFKDQLFKVTDNMIPVGWMQED